MSCPCEHKAKGGKSCKAGTPPVLKLESVECPVLFHTVVIPASVGTVETLPPTPGAYRNARVTYEADDVSYLYDSDGIPQLLSDLGRSAVESVNGKTGEVVLDADDVGAATTTDINNLQSQIDAITVASDVTDVVGTYSDLENYDTSTLSDNDIIKVLADETHGGAIYYYRWDTETQTFTAIGSEGPYYTKSETNTLLSAKQDTLTAGENITIENNVISATGGPTIELYTTYGQNEDGAMTQKATTDLVYTAGDPKKINIGDNGVTGGTNSIIIGSEDSGTVTGQADQIIIGHNATDSYTDTILIGHITESTGIGGIAIGKNAKTSEYGVRIGYDYPAYISNLGDGAVGIGYNVRSTGHYGVAIGQQSKTTGLSCISIGNSAESQYGGIAIGLQSSAISSGQIAIGNGAGKASNNYSVQIGYNAAKEIGSIPYSIAIGAYSNPRAQGVMDISTSHSSGGDYGYQGSTDAARTNLRVISGVHDGEQLHDAATVAQGNTLATSAPTTTTAGVLGQLYTDTTAMHTYQLTAIDTTDPSNPVYSWTQRW